MCPATSWPAWWLKLGRAQPAGQRATGLPLRSAAAADGRATVGAVRDATGGGAHVSVDALGELPGAFTTMEGFGASGITVVTEF